MTNFCTVVK